MFYERLLLIYYDFCHRNFYPDSSPNLSFLLEAEEEAVMRASTLANQVNCPLLIKSITSDSAADIIKAKKSRGNVLYAEVTPASLACDGNEYW